MRRLGRFLVAYLACVTLVMPLGWCCWLVPTAVQAEDVAKTCCCCPAEKPAPPKPLPETPRSCCKPTPAALLTVPDDIDPSLPALPVALNSVAFTQPRLDALPAVVAIDPSPPLHVLHCLWLC